MCNIFICNHLNHLKSSKNYLHFAVKLKIEKLRGEKFELGGAIRRHCIISPRKLRLNWQIKWKKPNGVFFSGSFLGVTNLQPRQRGRYYCIATHKSTKKSLVSYFVVKFPKTKPSGKFLSKISDFRFRK